MIIKNPPVCQIITSVLAGDPTSVKAKFSVKNVRIDVWIDNIRVTGSVDNVHFALEAIDKSAVALGVTFNDLSGVVKRYIFIGVEFDHHTLSIRPSERSVNKIVVPHASITIQELEVLISRLLFNAAITTHDLTTVFWILKIARRRLSEVNKGTSSILDSAAIPPSAFSQLSIGRVFYLLWFEGSMQIGRVYREGPLGFVVHSVSAAGGASAKMALYVLLTSSSMHF